MSLAGARARIVRVFGPDQPWLVGAFSARDVGHALYEFDTGGTVNFKYGAATDIEALCAKPMGLPCKKFN